MAFDFTGHVLRAPRTAPSNSPKTADADSGVVRSTKALPGAYALPAPSFVDVRGDQYRTAVLNAPGTTPVEYMFWAENTSNLAILDDPDWWVDTGTGTIPLGILTVTDDDPPSVPEGLPLPPGFGTQGDGTLNVIVKDEGNRSIGSILYLVIARGDGAYDDAGWVDDEDPTQGRQGRSPYLVVQLQGNDFDAAAGLVTITNDNLFTASANGLIASNVAAALEGGLSSARGDQVIEVRYTIAPPRFFWTRNDRYQVRFGWNGQSQRWEPFKGGAPVNLGRLSFDETYQIAPKPRGLKLGFTLPGDGAALSDTYSMIRLGSDPGYTSTAVAPDGAFAGIGVRSDKQVADGFDFSLEPTLAGVVGVSNGILAFNPAYVELHAGKDIWYVNRDFDPESKGIVGELNVKANLFISPVPGPTDRPLIRVGSRMYLSPVLVPGDNDLSDLAVSEGQVGVSLSTGKLKFSANLQAKTDAESAQFDKHYLGAKVVYDGLSLSGLAQPLTAPAQLVEANGKLYIPNALLLPDEFAANDPGRGLGVSGIHDVPDGTGAVPAGVGEADIRPGGDTFAATTKGRIRQVEDGIGDTLVFTRKGAMSVIVVDREADIPTDKHKIPKGTCYIAREFSDAVGSVCKIGRADDKDRASSPTYFLQSSLTPAAHTSKARLLSKTRFVFRFEVDDVLYFNIDGNSYTWNSNSILAALPENDFFTEHEVAASIQAAIDAGAGVGQAVALGGSVALEANNLETGSVEIGWGGNPKDLTGAEKLGFLPGWRVKGGVDNWLPDSGVALGLFRSPRNRQRLNGIPDFKAFGRVENAILQKSIQPAPFVFLQNAPLQDIAGYAEGVFFNIITVIEDPDGTVIVNKPLEHYTNVLHDFAERRFLWLEAGSLNTPFQQPTTTVGFGDASVIANSLLNAPGIGGGLLISEGGAFSFQELGTDYLLPLEGAPGNVVLITRYGNEVLFGGRGTYTAGGVFSDPEGSFTDPSDEQAVDADGNPLFSAGEPVYLPMVREGYRLKLLSGDQAGTYEVTGVMSGTELEVSPAFLGNATRSTPWELRRGFGVDVYDPAVVADQVYQNFNHLPEEPFKVNVLTPLGGIPSALISPAIEAAVARGRAIAIRFDLEHDEGGNSAVLRALTRTKLGTLANNLLKVPGVGSARFNTLNYTLRIGADRFTPLHVPAFSPVLAAGTVEVLTADSGGDPAGLIKFASDVLSDYAQATVTYQEEFLGAADVPSGIVEYNPDSGDINIGSADLAAHIGKTVYFVERMISENGLDVTMNPIAGAVGFQQPLQEGQVVEVCYYQADLEGRKSSELIQEFLPVFVTKAECTRVNHFTFTFNADGRTVDSRIPPTIFIGAMIQNFQGRDYLLEVPEDPSQPHTVKFISKTIPDHVTVKASYAVLGANGGERAYTVSTTPVYRPPFFLKGGVSSFGLQGDRTADFFPGQLIRLGADCFYVRGVEYFPTRATPLEEYNPLNPYKPIVKAGNVTKVHIFPPTFREVGTRAPGHDVLTVISAGAITTVVDPDGADPVATAAPAGFMQTIPLADFPFEPVNKGQQTITFRGDLTSFAIAGHVMEIGGYPYTISSSELNAEGTYTKITLTAPFTTGFSSDTVRTVKLSYRPLYPPGVRTFLPLGPLVETEPFELVLFGETDSSGNALPGRTLTPNVEYSLDPTSGAIELLEPNQAPLGPGQKLILSHTKNRVVGPVIQDGVVVEARGFATYLFNTVPSQANGLEGGLLQATFSFRSPDTFYFRIPTLTQFLAEAVQEAVAEIQAQQAGNGSLTITTPSEENWEQGNTGLLWERGHLADKDRAARTFLDFYNQSIVAFEQVNETIDGRFIGDRDGKFRFFVGKGLEWPTPGYEDAITGELLPKNLWSVVVNEANPANDLIFMESDPLIEPTSATLSGGVLGGVFPTADRLQQLISRQATLVTNDVDDLVVTRKQRSTVKFLPVPPYFAITALGEFDRMADSHALSRIFPTQAKAFFLTFPGVGADEATGDAGIYTYGRTLNGERKSTNQTEIATVSNPVLGGITNITESALSPRRARARVWGYFPGGVAANVFGAGVPAAPISDPCVIVVQMPLSKVPVLPDTGFIDVSQLRSQGGDLADAEAGDPELALPGFVAGDQVTWGLPDGSTYQGYAQKTLSIFGTPILDSLHVREVQFGCLITFADSKGNPLSDPNLILAGTAGGVPLSQLPLEQGATLFVSPTLGAGVEISDPPTIDEIRAMGGAFDLFRNGFDFSVRPDGRVLDRTLPSFDDPFPFGLKEIFGQNPPEPLSPIEGLVEFVYTSQLPLEIPALLGQTTDDDGDFAIPYLRTGNTELDRLGDAAVMSNLFGVFAQSGGFYVYPDEIVGQDGEILDTTAGFGNVGDPFGGGGATKEAGVLMTEADPSPVGVGQGSLAPYDLLLVECGQAGINAGSQGFLQVGAVRQMAGNVGFIEPPRFITPTTPPAVAGGPTGSPVRYVLNNAIVHVDGYVGSDPQNSLVSGVSLYEYDSDANATLDTLVIDLTSIAQIALNDGTAAGTGNLNDIWAAAGQKANNRITLRVLAREDSLIAETPGANPMPNGGDELFRIEIQGLNVTISDTVSGNPPTSVLVSGIAFGTTDPVPLGAPFEQNRHIVITGAGGLMDHLVNASGGLTPAVGSLTVLAGCTAGDTFTLGGVVFTAVNGGAIAADQQFNDVASSGSVADTAASLVATINDPASQALLLAAAPVNISATAGALGASITLNATLPGDVGELTLAENTAAARLVVSGPTMTGLSTSEWFIPYTHVNPLVPDYRRKLNYEYDFAIDIDTYNGVGNGESDTAYIGEDRLTFHEVIDFRKARQRGSLHPHAGASTSLETQLLVEEVTVAGSRPSSINRNVNGGDPLTFIGRNAADVSNENPSGTWTSPAGGTLKAVAFEGHSDLSLPGTGVRFSGIPSSPNGPTGVICKGSGFMESKTNAALPVPLAELVDDRVMDITIPGGSGAIANVEAGDILVVRKSGDATHDACTKTGTYLVKHAVEETDALTHTRQVSLASVAGGGHGWVTQAFPTVVSWAGSVLTVSSTDGFPAAGPGRVFVCEDLSKLTAATAIEYATAFWSGRIDGKTATTFTLGDLRDATGAALNASDVNPAAGTLVAGFDTLSVDVRGGMLPDSASVVGYHDVTPGSEVIHGFRLVHFEGAAGSGAPILYDATAGDITDSAGGGQIKVTEGIPVNSTVFSSDPDPVVYAHVPTGISIANVPDADWAVLNDPNGHRLADQWVAALLPNTHITLGDPAGPVPGFWAQGGIFLEPSFPTPVERLDGGQANVVEDGAAAYISIGARDYNSFNRGAALATPEPVAFEVRRIRRFHGLFNDIAAQFAPLRFAYEIRRGRITQYDSTDKQFGLVQANSFGMDFNADWGAAPLAPDVWNTGESGLVGTNLGPFNDADVNINAGDLFRLLDDNGNLLEQVEIVGVLSVSEIKLASPGLQTPKATLESNGGMRFEIWIRQAPVPHEQSNEQLLELITFRTVTQTIADYTTETGGYVEQLGGGGYDAVVNRMMDDENIGGWGAKGVRRGDIVLIDPTPRIPQTGERGSRPLGDTGAYLTPGPQRAGYSAGEPNPLDDNRGFYRVADIDDISNPAVLTVDGTSTLAGARIGGAATDVVFPEDQAYQPTLGYSILPTISGSTLTADNREGQADLRPTLGRVTVGGEDTYTSNTHSLRPFSYRIIRPSQLFSDAAVDLILMNRERTLSWIQELGSIMSGKKAGTYHVFQDDNHCRDLGTPGDPIDGLGVLGNVTVESLVGETAISPFLNTSDCLSILDRRFWIFDRRLDSLVPDNNIGYRAITGGDPAFPNAGGPYTAYTDVTHGGESVRPVLPERVDIVLDVEDQIRPTRYSWLAYRTHTVTGTLQQIAQFDAELPKRLAEAERAAKIEEAAENAET